MSVAIISHHRCIEHDMGDHPEQPARLHSINDQLISSGLGYVCPQYDCNEVEDAQVLRVHTAQHLAQLTQLAAQGETVAIDPDTILMPKTLRAARFAAGAGVMAVDLVMAGKHRAAWCPVRPPGHHAERAKAMGFCFFNNIAIAAAHALAHHGLERVAIVDFDVHHGNGTQDIVQGDPRILFCSSFQHPFYPFSGVEGAAANIHNLPLDAAITSQQYREHCASWLARVADFEPQMLFISAGFDGHVADEMSSHALVDSDYHWITRELVEIANRSAQGRIVSMLEGGYAINALGRTCVAHLKGLLQQDLM
ncbi:MAG: histone deacetylase family protein [Pseudomonadales bacterium]